MPVRSVNPTIAFIGVRISWLIFERKSLLARLSASAFFQFAAHHGGVQAGSRYDDDSGQDQRRNTDTTDIASVGLPYRMLERESRVLPMEMMFRLVITAFCSSVRLLIALLRIERRLASAGFASANPISRLSLIRLTCIIGEIVLLDDILQVKGQPVVKIDLAAVDIGQRLGGIRR